MPTAVIASGAKHHGVIAESPDGTTLNTASGTITASQTPGSPSTGPFDIFQLATATGGGMATVNIVRNSKLTGIVAGSPGTLPTNWSSSLRSATQTIATGTDATTGLPYIDWSLSGTPTAGSQSIRFDTTTGIACLPSTTYALSVSIQITSGTLAGSGLSGPGLLIDQGTASGTSAGYISTGGAGVSVTTTMTRFTTTITTASNAAILQPYFALTATAVAQSITFRILSVQLEAGSAFTAYQPTAIADFGVSRNSVIDTTTPGMASLLYSGHKVYRSDSTNYWNWTGTAWSYFGTTAPGGLTAIAYSTGANPGTNPTNNGFPSPLPLSSAGVAGQATSPVGWPINFYDDFNGTLSKGSNTLTTGAFYPYGTTTTLAAYSMNSYNIGGGFSSGGITGHLTTAAMSMSNSLMHFTVDTSGGGGNIGTQGFMNDVWGYWEASIRFATGANGVENAFWGNWWFTGANWPTMGEFDLVETDIGNTSFISRVHIGTSVNVERSGSPVTISNNSVPAGIKNGFHTYGAMITPSYLAVFIDGTLKNWGNSSIYLSNLQTATDPPTASSPGSFGWGAGTMNYDATFGFSLGTGGENSGTGFTTAQLPATMDVDWIRHSKLFPASGGPHV